MKASAVLCDLDGTLIDYYGVYEKETPFLIKKLREKNISFSLATGRAYYGDVARIAKELYIDPHIIVNGGGMIINWETGETPLFRPISDDSTKRIVQYLIKTGLVFCLETKEYPYMLKIKEPPAFMKSVTIREYTKDTIPSQVLKIGVLGSINEMTESEVDVHIKNIEKLCKDVAVIKFVFKEYYGLDVTSEASTKHTAVLEYANILGIDPKSMVAIGDGYNDYPLFTACGYTIAMGNAPKELKEIADKVVGITGKGGMKEALQHIYTFC